MKSIQNSLNGEGRLRRNPTNITYFYIAHYLHESADSENQDLAARARSTLGQPQTAI